jgi:formylglycine-generating enzyme required for sulfatase activity
VADDSPAAVISWNDAMAYCLWLSDAEHVMYRLPTEAEWEYARPKRRRSFFGDDHVPLDQYTWYNENAGAVARWKWPA